MVKLSQAEIFDACREYLARRGIEIGKGRLFTEGGGKEIFHYEAQVKNDPKAPSEGPYR